MFLRVPWFAEGARAVSFQQPPDGKGFEVGVAWDVGGEVHTSGMTNGSRDIVQHNRNAVCFRHVGYFSGFRNAAVPYRVGHEDGGDMFFEPFSNLPARHQ